MIRCCMMLVNGGVCMNDCSKEDIGRRFDALDTDGNGVLSPDELVEVISETLNCDDARYVY